MIHKIKAMDDEGHGSSIRAIAAELKISRGTVRKYLAMDTEELAVFRQHARRNQCLDVHRAYIVHLLETYPRLSAVKVWRKRHAAYGELSVSARTVRRSVHELKATVAVKPSRSDEPVLDLVPGVQCQVDGGERRGVMIGEVATTVYVVVFVLSYSRLRYVAARARPIDTAELIRLHDAAFRYFGGCPPEGVYDQTRLVVLAETFRELSLNERVHRYATTVGFRIRAGEGYDPESKGQVAAGVKYVKNEGRYGECFPAWPALEEHLSRWLEQTANVRRHGTTGEGPRERYERDERPVMAAYRSPPGLAELGPPEPQTRQVDKTGLIAFRANKYAVPLAYQRGRVGVHEGHDQLEIYDWSTGEVIARHALACGQGEIVKNTHHDRDRQQQIADVAAAIAQRLGEPWGRRRCARLNASAPRLDKDPLQGVNRVLAAEATLDPALIEHLGEKPRLSATWLRDYLEAYTAHPERFNPPLNIPQDTAPTASEPPASHDGPSPRARYATIGADNRVEVNHDLP